MSLPAAPPVPSARPFLKWAGGKTQLLPELRARTPKAWDPGRDPYAELFAGAGALYFDLRPRRALLVDKNPELVSCWLAVRDQLEKVLKVLRGLRSRYHLDPEGTYYEVRGWDPGSLGAAEKAARTIFLNKAGFNGLYRVNRQGRFNSPWCKNPRVKVCDEENLTLCSELVRTTKTAVECLDFEAAEHLVGPGALVYLDPPYLPRSRTSCFGAFTADKFTREDHGRLARFAARLVERGCHVVVSESDDEEVASLYRELGFAVDLVPASRRINSRGYGRGTVGEHVISRGPA